MGMRPVGASATHRHRIVSPDVLRACAKGRTEVARTRGASLLPMTQHTEADQESGRALASGTTTMVGAAPWKALGSGLGKPAQGF